MKRCFDVTFAILFLIPAFPILVICAIFIKLDSSGPVFFHQKRMGRHFRSFELLKLRTMHSSSEGSPYTLGLDPRITTTGRWLRRFKLDELPQIWNVLRGEMSIVGPRPVVPEIAVEFWDDYLRLLITRPGLTDPAALMYWDETEILALAPDPERCFKTIVTPQKILLSAKYMERASNLRDCGIIMQTAFAFIVRLVIPINARLRKAPGAKLQELQRSRSHENGIQGDETGIVS